MRIAEFLREELVIPELRANDKTGVLGELCAGLAGVYGSLDAQRLTEVLVEREKLGSTGIGEGVAIPHGKLPGIPGLIGALRASGPGWTSRPSTGSPPICSSCSSRRRTRP